MLAETLRSSTTLEDADIEWMYLLIGDWQVIADLCFADLVLWVATGEREWKAVAHVRPNTGPMVFYDDVVGQASGPRTTLLNEAFATRHAVSGPQPDVDAEIPVRERAIPVVWDGQPLGVITRHTHVTTGREPSRLEVTYRFLGDQLLDMLQAGEFPSTSAPTGARRGAPRVGDGVVHLDLDAVVTYASPNAISAIHRLGHRGEVIGENFAVIVADLMQGGESVADESLAVVATGRAPWWTEIDSGSASATIRAIPLLRDGVRTGAILLLRDVSELRRREQELLTKDATIREIHHRVKNNLQTVAALLRLQARRIPDPGARTALEEAVRRVGTIALVHETLSQGIDETVNFDEIALRGLRSVVDVAVTDQPVQSMLRGKFGRMRAEEATSLAMIISELVQNAVEHGLQERGGRIEVAAKRSEVEPGIDGLRVTITDDGTGLPAGFRPVRAGLGTRIVTSLVTDLGGRIRWDTRPEGGTVVEFTARMRPITREPKAL